MRANLVLNKEDFNEVLTKPVAENFLEILKEGYSLAKKNLRTGVDNYDLIFGFKKTTQTPIMTVRESLFQTTVYTLAAAEDLFGKNVHGNCFNMKIETGNIFAKQYAILVPKDWIKETTSVAMNVQLMILLHEIGHIYMGVGQMEHPIISYLAAPIVSNIRSSKGELDLGESIPDAFAVRMFQASKDDIDAYFDYIQSIGDSQMLSPIRRYTFNKEMRERHWAANVISINLGCFRK